MHSPATTFITILEASSTNLAMLAEVAIYYCLGCPHEVIAGIYACHCRYGINIHNTNINNTGLWDHVPFRANLTLKCTYLNKYM